MAPLRLTPKAKATIERLYRKGNKPSEIAAELGATAEQISRYVYKHGLSKERGEIKERVEGIKMETARDLLDRIRAQTQADLEPVLQSVADSLKIDAERLRDGWDMVENAADASALQRAKKLHQDRAFEFLGIGQGQQEPAKPDISFFFGVLPSVPKADPKPVEPSTNEDIDLS